LMRQAGYSRKVSGAFEAVASTGGQIMPPIMGAAAFLMAEFLEIAYVEVVIAAIIPSLLYYLAVFLYADLEAAKKNIAPVPKDQIPPLGRVLKQGWFYTIPFAVLIYALFVLNRSPEEAALWAAVTVILVNWIFGYKGRRMTPTEIYHAVRDTGVTGVDIVIIGAVAAFVAANLAGAKPMETAFTSVRIGWTALVVPVIFVTTPALIMQGEIIDIVLAFSSCAAGVWFGTVAFMGYFTRPMGAVVRIAFFLAAIALLIPANGFPGAGWLEIGGACLAAFLAVTETRGSRMTDSARIKA